MNAPAATRTDPGVFQQWLDAALRRVAPISPWALKLLSMRPDDPSSDRTLRELIASDPALLARVLGAANSRFFNPHGHEITHVGHAIQRLGTREVWRLATVLALGASTRIRPNLRQAKRALWVHSFTVAHAARAIAEASGREGIDADRVYVTALLHDIGLMVLLTVEPDRCERMLARAADPAIGFSAALEAEQGLPPHAQLGAEVCRKWGLPSDVVRLVGAHGRLHPLDQPPADRPDAACFELGHQIADGITRHTGLFKQSPRDDAPLLLTFLRVDAQHVQRVREAVKSAEPKILSIAESV